MKPSTFKKIVRKFGLLFLEHLIFFVIYGLFFSNSIALISTDSILAAGRTLWIMDIICHLIFMIFYFKVVTSYNEYRNSLKECMRDTEFSLVGYYKKEIFRDDLMTIAIFAVMQLLFTVFFGAFGYAFINTHFIDRVYALDAGIYAFTGSMLLGCVLNILIFAVMYIGIHFLLIRSTAKTLEENIIK